MTKIHFSLLIFLFGVGVAFGDTVTLKSGEIVEGKILFKNAKELTIEVAVTPSIKDERILSMADIASVDQKQEDEVAFLKIKDVDTPETSANVLEVDEILKGRLEPFLKTYPDSPYAGEVRKKIEKMEADRSRMVEGEIRFNGKWVDRAQYIAHRSYYDSFLALRQLQNLSDNKDLPGALNGFFEFERNYKDTAAYPDAIFLTIRNLEKFKKTAIYYLNRLPAILAEREKGIARSTEDAKIRIRAAVEQERARETALIQQAKNATQRYYPLFPENEEALKELQQFALQDLQRLSDLKATQWKQSVSSTDKALDHAKRGELDAAEIALKDAGQLWPESLYFKYASEEIQKAQKAAEESSRAQAKSIEDAAVVEQQLPTSSPGAPDATPGATPQ